jgi:HlyD family secretion protein
MPKIPRFDFHTTLARIKQVPLTRWQWVGIGALVVVGAASGTALLSSRSTESAQTVAPRGSAVTATRARNVCIPDTMEVTGVLVPRSEVLVRPDQEGLRISDVSADVGDNVRAGQTLAQLVRLDAPPGAAAVQVQAPVAGVILRRSAVVGTTASARADPLFSIIAQGELEVSADVSARTISRVSPGQTAKVKIIGVGELPGTVRFLAASVDPTTQQGEARILVGSNPALRVGVFARAIVNLGQSCAVAIPLSAVLYGTEGQVVQVVRGDRVETRTVSTGLGLGDDVQITKGLAEGDVVVTRAGAFLRDGDRVRPVIADDATASK